MAEQPSRDPNVFPIDTRFQQLARRAGGVARENAIEGAQRQIDDMKTGFVDWLDRELKELTHATRLVVVDPAEASAIERAYRASCELRDVGTTMGYELVTFVANNFCGILDALRAGAPFDRDMIDCHLDALLLAKTEPYRNLRPEQVPEMSRGLRRVVELASLSAVREAK